MLCNTSRLFIRNICLADSVKQRCFSVVNMPHNTDNRRSLLKGGFILIVLLQQFLDYINLDFLLTEDFVFHGNILCLFIGNLLIHCHNLAFQEKLLHNNGRLYLYLVGKILDGNHLR